MKFFKNLFTGQEKKPQNIQEILNSSLASEDIQAEITRLRETFGKGKIHGYVTVIKNPGRADEQVLCMDKDNILLDDGRDAMIDQMYIDTTASQVGFNHIALTVNTAAPADADTILTGEITTGGLARVLASTRTHSVGTNTATIQHTFTATATHTNVQKSGLFDLISSGIMGHEDTFTPATLASGDDLQVTWTLTHDD